MGFVEIDVELPLAALRLLMQDEGIIVPSSLPSAPSVPSSDNDTPSLPFRFLFKQAPVWT